MNDHLHVEVVVVGAGPGGYAAAFRSADLGKNVILIEKDDVLGGVCLNRGCIPSKTLLHLAKIIEDAQSVEKSGISFGKPKLDLEKIRHSKESIVTQLNKGIAQLAKVRNIKVIKGSASFKSSHQLIIISNGDTQTISFDNCIIATGSKAASIPGLSIDHPRIIQSSDALNLPEIPERMLVIGGGYIGLEMGSVYNALGSDITLVEFMPTLLSDIDEDLVKPLIRRLNKKFESIYLSTKVIMMEPHNDDVNVSFETNEGKIFNENYNLVLVSVGRKPNTNNLELNNAQITVDEKGFIPVNKRRQTSEPHIYAIGDVTGNPMLAHKATHEGKTAAEVISDFPAAFEPAVIPAVIYTDPEIAWAGPSENELQDEGINYEKGVFPWAASGRALALGRIEGKTKLLFDPEDKKIISVGIVGPSAGELIGEAILAIEMGANVEDIILSIHPHPTLTETIANAAEIVAGTITDLYLPK